VAALRAGIPQHVPGVTVHRNCASGIEAVAVALRMVRAGEARLVLAAGAECMSDAPFQIRRRGAQKLVRAGRKRGALAKAGAFLKLRLADIAPRNTLQEALTDPVSGLLMGDTAEVLAREHAIDRTEQDAFAAESQRRAAAAREAGVFRDESMPFLPPPRLDRLVEDDDGIRPDATAEKLARLAPVFDRRFGTVTVGNSCQISDGAAALVVAAEDAMENSSMEPLGRVLDVVTVGCDPRRMGLGPAIAIPRLLEKHGLATSDVDLFEINEAFAVQVLACLKVMGPAAPPADVLNVNGGAIALGHPVGATGTRLVLTLLKELRRRSARRGVAALCVGGGQGAAVLVESGPSR
jgi:acetyl-CoA acetyltransferase family protein